MTRCPHCTNDRDLEPLSGGRVLCPVCAKVSKTVPEAASRDAGNR